MSYAPPSIGAARLTVPSYADILADLLAQFQAIYPQNAYLTTDAADYQWVSAVAAKCADVMACCQLAYNNRGPGTAIGAGLDGIVKANGIARKAASASTATVVLTGTAGTVINNGVASDANGYLWNLPSVATIGAAGTVSVVATCQTLGSITASAGQIATITTPTAGWLSITNPAAAVVGLPVETDSQLRARQALSVSLPSKTMLAATTAAIAAVSGVTRYNVVENPTGSVDSFGNPAHSITAVVEGGSSSAIAQAIFAKRGIGCFTNGTTTVSVTDSFTGATMPISYSTPSYVPVYVSLSVHGLSGFTTATQSAIQSAIVAYLNSLQIGELVVLSELYGAALSVRPNPDLPMFSIRSLTLGTSASPTGTTDITMAFNQVAQGTLANVVLTVV